MYKKTCTQPNLPTYLGTYAFYTRLILYSCGQVFRLLVKALLQPYNDSKLVTSQTGIPSSKTYPQNVFLNATYNTKQCHKHILLKMTYESNKQKSKT